MDTSHQRRNRTRRVVVQTLGVGVPSAVLAACSVGPAAPPPAKKLQGTVELWTNSGYAYKDHIGAKLAQEFMEKNPGVKLNWNDTSYGDFMGKLVTTTVAGTPPDLSYADRFVTKSFACKGAASSLDEYVKRSKAIKMDNFWPLMRDQVTYKGRVFGLPHAGGVGVLWINKGIFREAGLNPDTPPATWDQAMDAIPRLARKSGTTLERAGWAPQRGWGVPWLVMYWQLGGELLDPQEEKAIFNNDKAAQVFDWLLRAHDLQGGEEAIAALHEGSNPTQVFAQGKAAMTWAPASTWRLNWANVSGLDVGASYWPTPPTAKHANYMGGWSLLIPKGAKNADGAFAYLEYKMGDDPQVRWSNEWETLPSTKTASQDPKYLGTRPERKIAVADAPFAKFVIGAPGGDQVLKYQTGVASDIFQRKRSIRDALNEAVQNVQRDMDEAKRNCAL